MEREKEEDVPLVARRAPRPDVFILVRNLIYCGGSHLSPSLPPILSHTFSLSLSFPLRIEREKGNSERMRRSDGLGAEEQESLPGAARSPALRSRCSASPSLRYRSSSSVGDTSDVCRGPVRSAN